MNTEVTLSGITLSNPIIPASGTFGYGKEFADLYDLNILGAISFKGTTKEARFGNPLPRIAECPMGLINSVGLQNPGVEAVINKELPELAKHYHKPLIANISGFSIEEYTYCAERLDKQDQVSLLEINVSCPNVHNGGMAYGVSPDSVYDVTKAVKDVTTKPIYIKLSPNVTDITEIAKACEAGGADGLSLINTLLGMRIDTKSRSCVIANKMGGFSGPAVFPVALRMVYQVAQSTQLPIIGIGGVSSTNDVIEMMMAGASAVQIGSANLINPYICKEIIEELPTKMAELDITNLSDIIGAAL
ncbi:dihydroorotate dehydrogenase [Streptococcus pacificus]|uniref:Dihydroorotate dehydrogenase n=1 Tax=Streptococcus pacificus TaxID=2740577 RepID=A0ABS0ZJC6_9STRE|nr:dihydroorotate dehydrogenase [Streptococcus pacificus]MBJ8325818.1 dihydroorotate dehydrogenase [Streptococcus pacificus]